MKNTVLVIIVTYNAMKWAERCFSSLRKSTIPNDVFVVDNGSTDGTQEYIKNNYSDFILVQNESNEGFGRANNIGLDYALKKKYSYIYLLNQDAWVSSDTFEILIDIQSRHKDFGIISPLQCNISRRFDDNFYATSLSNESVFDQLFPENDNKNDVYETDFVMAAHWLISRECLLKVGGFSPTFSHYGEDDNFIDRCKYHGLKVGYTFNTISVHDREFRPYTLSKLLYMQYTRDLVALSNPNKLTPSLFSILYTSIKNSVKNKTFQPIYYWLKIFKNKNVIKKNREKSRSLTAFVLG